jgi:hypothetical protein
MSALLFQLTGVTEIETESHLPEAPPMPAGRLSFHRPGARTPLLTRCSPRPTEWPGGPHCGARGSTRHACELQDEDESWPQPPAGLAETSSNEKHTVIVDLPLVGGMS